MKNHYFQVLVLLRNMLPAILSYEKGIELYLDNWNTQKGKKEDDEEENNK